MPKSIGPGGKQKETIWDYKVSDKERLRGKDKVTVDEIVTAIYVEDQLILNRVTKTMMNPDNDYETRVDECARLSAEQGALKRVAKRLKVRVQFASIRGRIATAREERLRRDGE